VSDRIRFHLDEPVDPDVARGLRKHGIDVTTSQEAGLRTRSDEEQLAFVRREHRVIVTHDPDFLRIAGRTQDHPGIAYCEQTAQSIGEIIRRLILVYEVLNAEEIAGRVEFL
jgi:predicted nuclease of predicted toxin-antitoxin system